MISIDGGKYKVFTKKIGDNPKTKVLLLHGGPGCTHEYFEVFADHFPQAGIEFYYYDQLGSFHSDKPNDLSLWNLPRFVEEVEQVRTALNLDKDNFYLYGQSWGGILAAQYALKYQSNLKGLIISNMMMSVPGYGKYSEDVLSPQLDPDVVKEVRELENNNDFDNPRYMELLVPHFYCKHVLRKPFDKWPDAVQRCLNNLNRDIYIKMQGPSEFGVRGDLANWDITNELPQIKVPTLMIGAKYDTMDPKHVQWASTQVQNGSYLFCPNGSHMCMWDDTEHYFTGLIEWLKTAR